MIFPFKINFNPRTPVGCDRLSLGRHSHLCTISIHAPQWGATFLTCFHRTTSGISIHAPQWGATVARNRPMRLSSFQSTHPSGVRHNGDMTKIDAQLFQSTHPSGVRPGFHRRHRRGSHISIHAPQWGATDEQGNNNEIVQFQSTHPSGVRRRPPAAAGR